MHAGVRAETKPQAVRPGRYMIRCPLVLERLIWDEVQERIVLYSDPSKGPNPYGAIACWDVLDFLAHLTQHIPQPKFKLTRYWGFYANAARGKRRREARLLAAPSGCPGPPSDPPPLRRRKLSWARLIKKVYELDPLRCAFCSAQLKVRSFTLELQEIRRFLRTLGETTPDALPLAHAPPTKTEPVLELL